MLHLRVGLGHGDPGGVHGLDHEADPEQGHEHEVAAHVVKEPAEVLADDVLVVVLDIVVEVLAAIKTRKPFLTNSCTIQHS